MKDGGGDYTEEFRIDTGVPGHDKQPVFTEASCKSQSPRLA